MMMLVPVVMFGYIPFVAVLFALMPARRAVLFAYVAGLLFLPMAEYHIPGLPAYTKFSAIALGALLGTCVFDSARLMAFRPRWFDIPMLVWFVVPMISSMTNDLGPYDGLSSMAGHLFEWVLPYFFGRLYFTTLDSMRELAIAIFVGGLLYVIPCWIEIRLSPHIHEWVYGFMQHAFGQTKRYGGFRPMVFMQHGLAVGMWMAAASLAGVWLWWSGSLRQLGPIPMIVLVPILLITTLFVKSFGALALLMAGVGVLLFSKWTNWRIALIALIAAPLLYMTVRGTGVWQADSLVAMAGDAGGEERAGSLAFRIKNENVLADRARERAMFGWGGWGRNLPEENRSRTIADGMWIIAFGQHGAVGLMAMTGVFIVGYFMLVRRLPPRRWGEPALAPLAVMTVLVALYLVDNLFNAMLNPVFILLMGAIPSVITASLSGGGTGARRPVALAGHAPVRTSGVVRGGGGANGGVPRRVGPSPRFDGSRFDGPGFDGIRRAG